MHSPLDHRFEIAGFYLAQLHPEHGGFWYACRYNARTRKVGRRSLKTSDFEQAKVELAALVALAPQRVGPQGHVGPEHVMTIAVLTAYLEGHGTRIASEEAAGIAVTHINNYLTSINHEHARVSFWTPAQQLEFARWCAREHDHGAGYIERIFNVMRSAFNDAAKVKIRFNAVGEQVEAALISHAPPVPWKREGIAKELSIPLRKVRPATVSLEKMGQLFDALTTEHLFRFAIMSLATWARPQAITDFDPATQVDWDDRTIDLAPRDWIVTNKRRPRQPLTQCLAGWLEQWARDDEKRRADDKTGKRPPAEPGLLIYKRMRVATVKRAMRRLGVELQLAGFSQKQFRHFMTDQCKKLFRRVPRDHRSMWLGHVVREGSRTTDHYESDDPHVLADVALATDCIIALVAEHCSRPLFAPDVLLKRTELEAIGAVRFPKVTVKSGS